MFANRPLLFSFLVWFVISVSLLSDRRVEAVKQPCKTCKEFVESFQKRFKDTEKSNYAGGDTSWEEEKLGSYANSEVRLVEILDGVCRHSDYDCHRILENNEEELELWWFKLRHKERKSDLEQWLCFSHLDVCCPKNTFGPTCEACPGGVDDPCGGRGSCEGSEERDGSGKCSCDKGYEGDRCQRCSKGYFNDTDEEKFTCQVCDKACKDSCSGDGPDMCDECADGYELNEEEDACKDIDECKDEDLCKAGTYCLNLPGSHKCNSCDKACLKICNGPGPTKCAECANGYTRDRAGICKDDNECEDPLVCKDGTYCENQPGSYICKGCHISCKLECLGPGASGCVECRSGYSMENNTCADVDECSGESNPCDSETETCQNLMGSYVCKCREGLVKSNDGKCVTEDELPPEEKPKKAKKKKKRVKKGGKNKKSPKKKERDGEDEVMEDGEPQLGLSTTDQTLENSVEEVTTAVGSEPVPPTAVEQNHESKEVDGSGVDSKQLDQTTNLPHSVETSAVREVLEPSNTEVDESASEANQSLQPNEQDNSIQMSGSVSAADQDDPATVEQASANVSDEERRLNETDQLGEGEALNDIEATRQANEHGKGAEPLPEATRDEL